MSFYSFIDTEGVEMNQPRGLLPIFLKVRKGFYGGNGGRSARIHNVKWKYELKHSLQACIRGQLEASVRRDLETSNVKIPRGLDVTEVWIVEAKLRPRGHLPRRGGGFVSMISDIKGNTPHPGSGGGGQQGDRFQG